MFSISRSFLWFCDKITERVPKLLKAQESSDPVLCPVEGAADGAFVYALFLGDLGNGQLAVIVGDERFALTFTQLLFDDFSDPLQLNFSWHTGA